MVLDTRTHIVALIERQRFAEAEEQLRRLTAVASKDGPLHALRALCLLELEHWQEALTVARRATEIAPDTAYCQWALAMVRVHCHEFRKARVAAAKAVRLEPDNADYQFTLARAEAGQAHWDEALAALDRALELEDDHEASRTLRGLILARRGQTAEASGEFLAVLKQNPTDAVARAGHGWVVLQEQPGSEEAITHFTDALQLDPTSEWAREGLIAALKARNPVYRMMLRYFLWMRARSGRTQLLYILGAILAYNFLRRTAAARPELAPFIWPVLGVYLVFLLLSWIAEPLFDLLLRLDANGRTALTRERIVASNWLIAGIVVVVLLGVTAVLSGVDAVAFAALLFGFMLLPLAGTFQCEPGWPRMTMATVTAVIAALGTGVLVGSEHVARLLFGAGILAAVASTWLNRWLVAVVPVRRRAA